MKKRTNSLIFGVLVIFLSVVATTILASCGTEVVAYDENEWPGWAEVGIFENPSYITAWTYPPPTAVGQKWKRFKGVRASFFPVATLPEDQHWLIDSVWTKIEPAFYGQDLDPCLDMGKCGRTEAGILVDSQGPRWFVWSQLRISCLRGTVGWLEPTTDEVRGCIGAPYHKVGLNKWNYVTLQQDPDFPERAWRVLVNGTWVATMWTHRGQDSSVIDGARITFYPQNPLPEGPYPRGGFWNRPPEYRDGAKWKPSPTGEARSLIEGTDPGCPGDYVIQDRVVDGIREGAWYMGSAGLGDGGPSVCSADPLY
jgi:hypothetical protein